jgi:sugar/nucleoside kinase (ribokinase family)
MQIAEMCEISIVKVGAKGSMIKTEYEKVIVGAIQANPIDTTGAGDLYAAGFLYGLANDLSIEKCAKLGSLIGGNVIEVIGPKMDETQWVKIRSSVSDIISE